MQKKFGEYFKRLREKSNLTQSHVAFELGYTTPQFISNIERNRAVIPPEKIQKVSEIFNEDVEVVFQNFIADKLDRYRRAAKLDSRR